MGKRSNFKRKKRDAYDTTAIEAVAPLIPHLTMAEYVEPCAGKLDLVKHLRTFGFRCKRASDIAPRAPGVRKQDVFAVKKCSSQFITNPPWDRPLLHAIIMHLSEIAPTWLLFDADWMHTKQARPYLKRCRLIISVGRVKWIKNSKNSGKDNCAWYFFDKNFKGKTVFIGRQDDAE